MKSVYRFGGMPLMVTDGMFAVNAAEQHLKDAWSEALGVSFAPYVTINRPSE